MQQPDMECRAWCDSTVTLAWIRKPSHCWQTFVANRVSTIQSLTSTEIWQHVPGSQNPADIASRGLTPAALKEATLWWRGPSWLNDIEEIWPRNRMNFTTHIDEKPSTTALHLTVNELDLLGRFSSFIKLQRVTAMILRFSFNCKHVKQLRRTGWTTTAELIDATNRLIQITQQHAFSAEISTCSAGTPVAARSPLKSLNPFLDEAGILRVGGRINNANVSFDTRHPAILPKKCDLTDLLINYTHMKNLHSGPQLTSAALLGNAFG